MTDAYSPLPELNLLKEFEDGCEGSYAHWAWMDDFGEMEFLRDDPELLHGLLGFASANLSGSLYALWKRDDRADLATLPVVLLGDEGGIHLVARDVREFLRLLGALGADLACDWDDVYEQGDDELPARADYLLWLERNFGLTPPDDAWDVIEAAQEELAKEWAAWIHPLLPDAVFSPVHELNLLKRFDDTDTGAYGGGFLPLAPEDGDAVGWDGASALMPFALANDDGDRYALWRVDDRSDPAALPVVLVGEAGGHHVVARNVREFLRLLGALDGVEVRVEADGVGLRPSTPAPAHAEYLVWLDEHLGLTPARDAAAAIRAAQADTCAQRADDAGSTPLPDAGFLTAGSSVPLHRPRTSRSPPRPGRGGGGVRNTGAGRPGAHMPGRWPAHPVAPTEAPGTAPSGGAGAEPVRRHGRDTTRHDKGRESTLPATLNI